ncbi:hypothetical protein Tcan_02999 [Toxocara canis]|uniref:Sulfite exporter TauE/SafE family protein 3 n=1 Tax=Toxocara canis TaxID=6265 RepID=A0A0B2V3Z2_TOXCA|nr:hypothetical protein Tcan_02999 [Toxocara canis]
MTSTDRSCSSTRRSAAALHFLKKYFLEGVSIPFVFFQTLYWLIAFRYNLFYLYNEKYVMSIVMIFGALIGGMTTEGGGAVAFPVMTIALNISPVVARDFSLMIQSCGLTAASFTIFFMSIAVEWHSIVFSTFGSTFGIIFGFEIADQLLSAAEKKMMFVSVFFSFAIALFLLNSERKRITFDSIHNFTLFKAVILIANGFIGGILTGIAGSGVDVCSFSILTLLFRISEKVATPTSVVLMSANSMFGFFWRRYMDDAISQDSWEYFAVCLPVVVFFAPLGSFMASHFHRLTLAVLIYILETVALVGAVVVLRPALPLLCASASLVILSFAFYYAIGRYGKRMADQVTKLQQAKSISVDKNLTEAEDKGLDIWINHRLIFAVHF